VSKRNQRAGGRTDSNRKADLRTYLLFLAGSYLAVTIAFSIQAIFVLERFEPRLVVVPTIMATVIGLLLARITILGRRLRSKNSQFRAVADLAREFIYFRNNDGSYEYVSPAAEELTGYPVDEFYATPDLMDRLIHPDDLARWRNHVHQMTHDGNPESLDLRITTRDQREVWITHICGPVFDHQGSLIGQRSTNIDITERKSNEARIEQMAYFDSLTELPNRNLLCLQIEERIEQPDGHGFALLFLDLYRFNHLNDSMGHDFGDQTLQGVANRLLAECPTNGLVARFGGDEFVVIVPNIDYTDTAIDAARQLLALVEQPMVVEGMEIFLSAGVGIALYPNDGIDSAALIRNAEAAMYRTKRIRTNQICLYNPRLVEDVAGFVDIENRLRKALGSGEFFLLYQPKVDIGSQRIISVEALARWQSPERGMIPPCDFIPVAEETGLIRAIGEQILTIACQQLKEWQDAGIAVPIAVNISGVQFADQHFVDQTRAVIDSFNCDPELLEFEVTEQVFLNDLQATIEKLEQLRELGIRIALDDFGTGYSSLNYIRQLPLDAIKIDMSFVRNIARNQRDLAILRAIVILCQDLDMVSIAEGIEESDQHSILSSLGCSLGQGFLFYRPMPAEELTRVLRENGLESRRTQDEPAAAGG
jgi:diguanylate cyclase (GGDEF)-like protein/PAS domain S-box-containing protein